MPGLRLVLVMSHLFIYSTARDSKNGRPTSSTIICAGLSFLIFLLSPVLLPALGSQGKGKNAAAEPVDAASEYEQRTAKVRRLLSFSFLSVHLYPPCCTPSESKPCMAAGVLISGCCHSSRVVLLLLLVCRVAVSARGQLAYEQLLAHCPPPPPPSPLALACAHSCPVSRSPR